MACSECDNGYYQDPSDMRWRKCECLLRAEENHENAMIDEMLDRQGEES